LAALLEVRGLVKAFGGFRAVDDVDLTVGAGTIHSVIGPNGAGKTTLFNLITGHLRPTHGRIYFSGADLTGKAPHIIARGRLARAFQITNVFPRLTVLESVQCALLVHRRRTDDLVTGYHHALRGEAMETIDAVGLAEVADQEAQTLSHGDQRALEIALALATRPRFLLLDEPTAGMASWETDRMIDLIRGLASRHGLTVLLSEHAMNVVFSLSDRVTVMHRGRIIAEGNPGEVRGNEEVVRVYLGDAHA
jgi:branched-chain amino acid transport system ATP-binding protein